MIENENRIIALVLNGNINEYGKLIKKYQAPLFHLALKIVHDEDIAKDIVQETFVKTYQNLKRFNKNKKFYSWIYRVTLNEAINQQKKSKYFEQLDAKLIDSKEKVDYNFEKDEISKRIEFAVSKLEPKYQSLIVLKHYQNFGYDEIAEILDIPVGKVKSRLYMARGILKKSLRGIYNDK